MPAPDFLLDRILYRDPLIIVINKPAGMPVHAGPGGGDNLEQYFDALRFGNNSLPGLAHRLDRDTSGCLILGRQHKGLSKLGKLFMSKSIRKSYWAIVKGTPERPEGCLNLPLSKQTQDKSRWWMKVDPNGQEAITDYKLMGSTGELSWLELHPHTGRTHQLRVHCQALGCPIMGDKAYGNQEDTATLLHLHARSIRIPMYHNQEPIFITAPPPPHMMDALLACGYEKNS
jgi:tRNA pseudouridine32 synthase / 23S rRNA pseudouridine746 synthase